jgi:putative transposase
MSVRSEVSAANVTKKAHGGRLGIGAAGKQLRCLEMLSPICFFWFCALKGTSIMTQPYQSTNPWDAVQLLAEHGFEGMAQAMELLLNEAMKIERSEFVGAGPYQRSESRKTQANGFKPKTVNSRLGQLHLQIPQTRDCQFYPSALERGERSERAMKLAIAEMYVQGVSTRKVAKITEELCGLEVSSTQVSRAAQLLDQELQAWRTRELAEVAYLILDARYERVRVDGVVRDCAVLVAVGVLPSGCRSVLGVSVSLSEAEVHWREFLSSLVQRGLHGVRLIASDAHEGLQAARKAVFPSVPWQRCQFHLMQNAMSYVPKQSMRESVAEDLRSVLHAKDLAMATEELKRFSLKYEASAPKLVAWAQDNLPEGLAVLALPSAHRKRMRTTNMLERQNKEIKRRTRVATLFPNEASLLRLVTAVLIEINDEWISGKIYLKFAT